jgi:hypothetical protein
VTRARGAILPRCKTFTEDREMDNLEKVKDLLFQAGALIEMHYAGLMTTNETLLSVIEIIEKAVDVHAEGGTIKAGEIDKNTGDRIKQGWVGDEEQS